MKFVALSLLATCVIQALQATGQQTFECPGLEVPDGCGAYVNCNNGRVEKDCSGSTPDCDQGADFCLQNCVSCSGAGDDEDDIAVLSADDCLRPGDSRGPPPPNDRRIPAWGGSSWEKRTATYTGIGRMTRTDSTDKKSPRCAHCTGFAIEDNFILTAAHCVVSDTKPVKKIAFGRVGDNIKTHVADVDMKKCRWSPNYRGDNDEEFDYAVCKVSKSLPKTVTKFDISTRVETADPSFSPVNIAGYPILNYPASSARENRFKLPFQLGSTNPCQVDVTPTSQADRKILVGNGDCTVTTGQSGSPIFKNGTGTLRLYGVLAKNNNAFRPYGPALTQPVIDDLNKFMSELR